jgi:hypothetical protein
MAFAWRAKRARALAAAVSAWAMAGPAVSARGSAASTALMVPWKWVVSDGVA